MRHANALPLRVRRVLARTSLSIALLINCSCGQPAAPPAAQPTAPPSAQPAAPPLWKPIEWDGTVTPTPQAIRSQVVAISIEQLQPPSNERISLTLPDGSTIAALKVTFQEIGKKQFIWRGTIEGDAGSVVTFSVVNDKLVGDIVTSRGKMYRVRFVEKGVSIVEQLDPAKFPVEGKLPRPESYPVRAGVPADARSLKSVSRADGSALIDVMVLYTNAVSDFAVAEDAITATINQAVSDTNQAYEDSEIRQRIRLVHVQSIAYEEDSHIGQYWQDLMDTEDAEMDEAHDLRRSHSADIVVLITKPALENESCGRAMQMQSVTTAYCVFAFAVVPVNCATGTYSFAHELGHIMGADHNVAPEFTTTNDPPFPYSHGYEVPTKAWHTIMASPTLRCVGDACPPRILRWSNPSVSYVLEGSPPVPTGVSGETDNASTLNNTADTVANFYPSPDCNEAPLPPEDISAS